MGFTASSVRLDERDGDAALRAGEGVEPSHVAVGHATVVLFCKAKLVFSPLFSYEVTVRHQWSAKWQWPCRVTTVSTQCNKPNLNPFA
jgi:hypothetical protein